MTLRQTATALARKELTVTAHIEQTLTALDELKGTAWENLVAARADDAALSRAAQLDRELARDGWRGPLHGVAVAIKDNIDVVGMPTRCGSAELADATAAEKNAWIVDRLQDAGAIVVAKAHLHEFAYGPTGQANADGPAANPHDPTRITGGSSSGSAALVAKGVVPLAVGTDTGCSVRVPSALCGVVGLKPTLGALSTRGVFPLSTTLDHVGLIAEDVVDTALAWGAVPGVAHLPTPVVGLRIGRLRGPLWQVHDPEIEAALDRACTALTDAGATVRDVELPHAAELSATYPVVVGCEALETHMDRLPGAYQASTLERLAGNIDYSATDYLRAARTMARMRDEALHTLRRDLELDALLTATTPIRATGLHEGTVDGRRVASELLRMCIPFSTLGIPTVSVPAPGVDGLPIGLQLAGLATAGPGVSGTHPGESTALALALAVSG
ncbi:amidase [Rhodococcus sp. D2-41]|uniref:Amidase n=1 Tax=Speluncibacter jeojiensis TaxID=2710754 RepID=A0A9X4LYV2_9ACTN|nr:amidase [Rhodococcus sp. D2-41]MDG3010389.1 amidase [Rhodococcus sp. D2-41]MDG3014126.1 amidase [Corynebacteriales bacterium D3-21]